MIRLALLLSLSFLPLFGQTPDLATIRGRVTDPSHAAAAGVSVTAENSVTGTRRTAQTNADGKFSIAGLPISGEYTVTVTAQNTGDEYSVHRKANGEIEHKCVSITSGCTGHTNSSNTW